MPTFHEIYEHWKTEQDVVPCHEVTYDAFFETWEFTCDNCNTPLSDDEVNSLCDPDDTPVCHRCLGAGYCGLPRELEEK